MDVAALLAAYTDAPDVHVSTQRVAFGTSGHRGSSLTRSFNEAHILAITQAVCEYRARQGITGPLFIGKDTHALSEPAQRSAARSAGGQRRRRRCSQADDGYTPTPVDLARHPRAQPPAAQPRWPTASSSRPRTIRRRMAASSTTRRIGGPADTDITGWIEDRANALLREGNRRCQARAVRAGHGRRLRHAARFRHRYVADLAQRHRHGGHPRARVRIGVDPMGGAAVAYWERIAERYGLDIDVVNRARRSGLRVHDPGSRRQDPHGLLQPVRDGRPGRPQGSLRHRLRQRPRRDRHGIVTPSVRPDEPEPLPGGGHSTTCSRIARGWRATRRVGKTLVSSSMIDRVAARTRAHAARSAGRLQVVRRPGCSTAACASAAKRAPAPASCAATASVWTTDKDGIILGLLAAEITAVTGKDPGEHYQELTSAVRHAVVHAHRCAPPRPSRRRRLRSSHRQTGHRHDAGRRADHRPLTTRAGQRRRHRRAEGDDRQRLVRRPAVGHRKHLQDLRRELHQRSTPRADRRRGAADRHRRAGLSDSEVFPHRCVLSAGAGRGTPHYFGRLRVPRFGAPRRAASFNVILLLARS